MLVEIRGKSFEDRSAITLSEPDKQAAEAKLRELGFVYIPGGLVRLGTPSPLPCRFEGIRRNESPVHEINVDPFWLSKFTVTNAEYEKFNPRRVRPQTSLGDNQPATNITYFGALAYVDWLSKEYHLKFSLPTESEWVHAAAPYGWEYPYHEAKASSPKQAWNFILGETEYRTLDVNDDRFGMNVYGLYHIGGNVQEFTLGSYYTQSTTWGFDTDGRYAIIKGGDFGHCPLSSGVHRRALIDISFRSERVGFRLFHPEIIVQNG